MWKIVVSVGDIAQQQVGAHHKPASSLPTMGGGAADAIKRVGGKEIETEALKHAPVSVGKAIATSTGKLKAKHVIHAPTMNKPVMSIGKINVRLAMIGASKMHRRIRNPKHRIQKRCGAYFDPIHHSPPGFMSEIAFKLASNLSWLSVYGFLFSCPTVLNNSMPLKPDRSDLQCRTSAERGQRQRKISFNCSRLP